jgi:nucleoid-associated protein YgaU
MTLVLPSRLMSDAPGPRRRLSVLLLLLLTCAGLVLVGVFWFRGSVPPESQPEQALSAPRAGLSSPATPAVPPAGAAQAGPSFDIVRINPQGEAVMAGRAAPGAEVTIRGAGREIGRTRADAQGSWVILPSGPLEPGARELTLSARDPDGRETQGQGSVLLVVPERSPTTVAQAAPPLAVLTGRDAASRLLQSPPPGDEAGTAPGAKRLGLGVVDYDERGDVRVSGTAPPGAAVRLYVDDRPAGDAVADADGRWVLTPTGVAPGPHQLRLDQLTRSGKVAARMEVAFRREAQAAGGIGEGRVVVQHGQNLWQLARHAYGSGLRYTVIFEANRAQIRDPQRIYPGQTFAVPAAPAASPPSAPVTPVPPGEPR